MTTPADNTPIKIIEDAYLDAGLIRQGQQLNSDQISKGMRRLTDVINLEQTQGLKLWLNFDLAVTLTANIGTYKLGPTTDGGTVNMTKPMRVVEGYYLYANGTRQPLIPLSWDDYIRLSQVNTTGALNSYFVNKQQLTLDVFFWLIPDANAALGTGHILIQQQVTDFISCTETMNFPLEWRMFLRWALADDLATGQPEAIQAKCSQMMMKTQDMLENWDVEDAPTQFTPDPRAAFVGSSFL